MYRNKLKRIKRVISEILVLSLIIANINYVPVEAEENNCIVKIIERGGSDEYYDEMTKKTDEVCTYRYGKNNAEKYLSVTVYEYNYKKEMYVQSCCDCIVVPYGYIELEYLIDSNKVIVKAYADEQYTIEMEQSEYFEKYYVDIEEGLYPMKIISDYTYAYDFGYVTRGEIINFAVCGSDNSDDVLVEKKDYNSYCQGYVRLIYDEKSNYAELRIYNSSEYDSSAFIENIDYFIGFVNNLNYSNIMTNDGDGTYSYYCGYVYEGDTEFGIYSSTNWGDGVFEWGIYSVYSDGYGKIVFNPANNTVGYLVYSDDEYTDLVENTQEKPDFYCGTPGLLKHMEKVEDGKYEYECGYVGMNSKWGYGIYGNSGRWSDVVLEWCDVTFQDNGYAKVYYDSATNSSTVKLYTDESYTVLLSDLKRRYIRVDDEYLELNRGENNQYSYECGYYEKGTINLGILDYDKTVLVENKDYTLEIGGYIKVYYNDDNYNVRVVEYFDDEYSIVSELYYIVGSDYYDYCDKGIFTNCWGYDESEWNVELQVFDGEPEYLDRVGRINVGNYLVYYSANKAEIGKRYKFSILNGRYGYYTLEDYSFVAISDGYVYIKYYYDTNKCSISYFDYENKPDIGLLNIELSEYEYVYDGEDKKPEVIIDGLVEGEDYTVRYDDDTVNAGKKKVYIKGINNYIGEVEAEVEYEIKCKDIEKCNVELDINQYTYKHGVENHPIPVVKDGGDLLKQDVDYEVEYPEDSSNVGEKEAKIIGLGNYSGCIIKEFEINACDIDGFEFELSKEEYVYSGSENEPIVSVKDKENNYELVENIDYTVEYESNINVGKAKVIVKGKGNYGGEADLEFKIVEKDISECDVTCNPEKSTYNRKQQEIIVEVYDGERKLINKVDYEIEYPEDLVNAGEKEIVVKGIGNYTSEKKIYMLILEKDVSECNITIDPTKATYTGNEIYPTVTIKDGDDSLELLKDFEIEYSEDSKNVGEKVIVITGIGNYNGCIKKNYSINPMSITGMTLTLSDNEYTYSGLENNPTVTLEYEKNGNQILLGADDYDVEITNNINAGEAKVIITGNGNYTGEIEATFLIHKKDINTCDISLGSEKFIYTGSEIVSDVLVVDSDFELLKEGEMYSVSYEKNIDVGTASVIISGIGNYCGEKTLSFKIEQKNITECDMTVTNTEKEYDGKSFTPEIKVKDGDRTLKNNIDYQVVYQDDVINVGEKIVKIIGIGNYFGEGVLSYKIIEAKKDKEILDLKEGKDNKNNKDIPKVGEIIKDKQFLYKVLKCGIDNEVGEIIITKLTSKKTKKLIIKDYVVIDGIKYKVVGIEKKAFAKCKRLKKVVIGRNVTTIGAYAFYNCKKLKKVSIKSQQIIKIGKKAFYRKKGKKLRIIVPAKLKKKYKKFLKKSRTNNYIMK